MEYGYVYVMSANEIFMLNAERIQLSVHISVHKIVLFFFSLPVVVALLCCCFSRSVRNSVCMYSVWSLDRLRIAFVHYGAYFDRPPFTRSPPLALASSHMQTDRFPFICIFSTEKCTFPIDFQFIFLIYIAALALIPLQYTQRRRKRSEKKIISLIY